MTLSSEWPRTANNLSVLQQRRMNKLGCIHAMGYYFTMQETHSKTWVNLKGTMLTERSVSGGYILFDSMHIKSSKKQNYSGRG